MSGTVSITRQQAGGTIHIQRTWPQLGREFYNLECELLYANNGLDERQKNELREKLRAAIIEQCREYEKQYEAYELVKGGRAVEIVGNPHYLDKDGGECELPYTGLEGYYAGSEERPGRPGMTREETYSRLKDPCGRVRHIDYHIEDASFADGNIVETLSLPQPEDRDSSPPYLVHLTPKQREGYLFLAYLGEKGGDPLIRGILLSTDNYFAVR